MSKKVNMVDKKFGRWSVTREASEDKRRGAYWHCLCACGHKGIVEGGNLRSGKSKSCGCIMREKTAIKAGQKFGRLEAIEHAAEKSRESLWLCVCECGGTKIVTASHLRKGGVKSCGCWGRESKNIRPPGVASFNSLYNNYKCKAKKRGFEFVLTKDQFGHLTKQNCLYCGKAPEQRLSGKRNTNGAYTYNGIDRVDASKGYILSNCVPCCKKCNQAKMAMTLKEYIAFIVQSYRHIQPILAPGYEVRNFGPTAIQCAEASKQ